jgi:U3 small nucleolar RNA-associated protein 12
LKAQCCIQTIPTHRGEVWGAACLTIPGSNPLGSDVDITDDNRIRLVTGSSDGQARVWSVQTPKRYENKGKDEGDNTEVAVVADGGDMESVDDVCHYMGALIPPPNVSTSSERIACIHFHPNGKHLGVLHANSKNVDVYLIRSVQESLRKKQRRLRRRKEKSKLSAKNQESGTKGQKRGMLDDPESEDEKAEETEKLSLDQTLSPEQIKASDEFEYFETVRASHKVKGFIFVPYKEQGGGVRVVCSLSTNALEVHSLTRKAARSVTFVDRRKVGNLYAFPTFLFMNFFHSQ